MQAICITKSDTESDGPKLSFCTVIDPAVYPHAVKVRVKAIGVNYADIMQRRGHYPAPPGFPQDIPGLEFAGCIEELGEGCKNFGVGDRVFGLVGGGAYAEYVVAHEETLLKVPKHLNFHEAAAIPEAFMTAYDAIIEQAQLKASEYILINAVGSGVGLAALQIAHLMKAHVIGTSRSAEKLEKARAFGLERSLLVSGGQFAETVLQLTENNGVDVILELVGGSYLQEDLGCLALRGRIMLVGLSAGRRVEIDLSKLLAKRVNLRGTTLRSRSLEEKIALTKVFTENILPHFEDGKLKPVIDSIIPWQEVSCAHELLEESRAFGKVILAVGDS